MALFENIANFNEPPKDMTKLSLAAKTSYMNEAIAEALKGAKKGCAPFGAVIVHNGYVVGRGYTKNKRHSKSTEHAIIRAIKQACKNMHSLDLTGCVLFTTAYPCVMCQGAIQLANIEKIYYGCTFQDVLKHRTNLKNIKVAPPAEEFNRQECLKVFDEVSEKKQNKK